MGIEPINTAHGWSRAFDNLRFEMMHEVEHRFDEGATAETDQRDALLISLVGTRGMPDCTVEQEYGAFRGRESDLIGMMRGAGRRFDSLEMDTRDVARAAVLRCKIVKEPETVSDQRETR